MVNMHDKIEMYSSCSYERICGQHQKKSCIKEQQKFSRLYPD